MSDMDALQWSGLFSRYSITLTNRFHASIFSLKNRTPVITVDCKAKRITADKTSKSSLLLDGFGLKESNYKNSDDLQSDLG